MQWPSFQPLETRPFLSYGNRALNSHRSRRHQHDVGSNELTLLWMPFLSAVLLTTLCDANVRAQPRSEDLQPSTQDSSPFEGMVFYCTECMTEVPERLGAGSQCPHCGAFFKTATNADGTQSSAAPASTVLSVRVVCGIALVVLFGAEYGWRRWRRRS